MMLVLFEKIVKSHFDVLDEEDPALEEDWNDFIRINVSRFFKIGQWALAKFNLVNLLWTICG